MKKIIDFICLLVPFLNQYPFWVKTMVGIWVIFSAVVLLTIIFTYPNPPSPAQKNTGVAQTAQEKNTTEAEKRVVINRLKITYPLPDNIVGTTDMIRGYTPYAHKNHYLVVMPLETGDEWVQEGPLKIYEGAWAGRVKFGTAATLNEAKFAIRVMATSAALQEGPLTVKPKGAVFSDPVIVKLKK